MKWFRRRTHILHSINFYGLDEGKIHTLQTAVAQAKGQILHHRADDIKLTYAKVSVDLEFDGKGKLTGVRLHSWPRGL